MRLIIKISTNSSFGEKWPWKSGCDSPSWRINLWEWLGACRIEEERVEGGVPPPGINATVLYGVK